MKRCEQCENPNNKGIHTCGLDDRPDYRRMFRASEELFLELVCEKDIVVQKLEIAIRYLTEIAGVDGEDADPEAWKEARLALKEISSVGNVRLP